MILTIIIIIFLFKWLNSPTRKKSAQNTSYIMRSIAESNVTKTILKLGAIFFIAILIIIHWMAVINGATKNIFSDLAMGTSGMVIWPVLAFFIWKRPDMARKQRVRIRLLCIVQGIMAFLIMLCASMKDENKTPKMLLTAILILNAYPYYLFWKQCIKVKKRKAMRGYALPLQQIDAMDGFEFERYCARMLRDTGNFVQVQVTPGSGDFGADIVAIDQAGHRWVWQCKNYSAKLTNKPIQEVVTSMAHYNADRAGVITNSTFTPAARQLANENGVKLIDRTYFI